MSERLEDYALGKKGQQQGVIQKIGVVGCGNMGQEIVRIISQSGLEVCFIDLTNEKVEAILQSIGQQLDEIIAKWGLTSGDKRAILSRIEGTTDYNKLADCDVVIETINAQKPGANLDLRKNVLKQVEAVVNADTLICTNTSTLMVSDIADEMKNPERVIGTHFLAPVANVKIIEVTKGVATSEESLKTIDKFAKMIGKKTLLVNESPGAITTRLILPLINEACQSMMEGLASVECIDLAMRDGYGMQFGPFEMADRIGLDKVLKWMENMYNEFGDHKFIPSPIIRRLVRQNYLGRKTGAGFYKYEQGVKAGQSIALTVIK